MTATAATESQPLVYEVTAARDSTPAEPAIPDDADAFEVRVKLTIAIPYRGRRGLMDACERVLASLRQEGPLPEGSYLRDGIDITARTAKEMRADKKRADAKRRRNQ